MCVCVEGRGGGGWDVEGQAGRRGWFHVAEMFFHGPGVLSCDTYQVTNDRVDILGLQVA